MKANRYPLAKQGFMVGNEHLTWYCPIWNIVKNKVIIIAAKTSVERMATTKHNLPEGRGSHLLLIRGICSAFMSDMQYMLNKDMLKEWLNK